MLLQLWRVSHLEAWSLWSLYRGHRGADVWDGSCTGSRPYDHSQPVAHMSSLSFSSWIKSALFVLQNQRLHAGGSHSIVGLQKLGRRRIQGQICCVAPTCLHPGLHPTTTHCCRPGRGVRIFFQSRRPWKGAHIYLSALCGPNQQGNKNIPSNIPRQLAFLLQALSPHCSPLPATLSCLHIYPLSPRLTSISLR